MNALSSVVDDLSVARVLMPAGHPLGPWAGCVCLRMDEFPCPPAVLADMLLTPAELAHWKAMRAVAKRRHEWLMGRCVAKQAVRALDPHLHPGNIEILADAYGRPQVRYCGTVSEAVPALSIAHSQGTAVALATLAPGALAGIDIESLEHRREAFEAVAFSPDERAMLATFPATLAHEWALRMWCAKEATGKALGRGLSAGLPAFHITSTDLAAGIIEVRPTDAALMHLPELRGKSMIVYTARESNFVFSAIIYQQGAVRMRPSRQEIMDYLLQKLGDLCQDWDYPDPVTAQSLLFTQLGFESLDAVVLCTAIQEHYQKAMPFAELLAEIGQQQRDLSINELTDFVHTHLNGPTTTANPTGRIQ